MASIELKILNKELYSDNTLPTFATDGSAAIDLKAPRDIWLPPKGATNIKSGLAIHIASCALIQPIAALVLPRSGLGTKGLVLGNTVGLIDEDYQGEIIISLLNRHESTDIIIKKGDRFAQLMFIPVIKPTFKVVDEFTTVSKRSTGGFGSTGNS